MIETSCKGCVFSKNNKEGKQESCQIGRLEKLQGYKNEGEDFFKVKRFCNTFRPSQWLNDLSLDESLNIIETVKKEIIPRVGILIDFDTDLENPMSKLKDCIQSILDQTFSPRYVIIVNRKVEYNEDIQELLSSSFDERVEHHIVQLLTSCMDSTFPRETQGKTLIIDECFRHFMNGWVFVTTIGESIPKNLMSGINKIINEDMEILTVVEPYDGFNGMIFQTALFKFLNGNMSKVWGIEDVDSRPFLEKVKDMEDAESVMSWEEFYGKIS